DLAAQRAGRAPARLVRGLLPLPPGPRHCAADVPRRARRRGPGRARPDGRRRGALAARRRRGAGRGGPGGGPDPRRAGPRPPARLEAPGVVIPALHAVASARPVPYVPVCAHSAVPVCVQPAYRSYLPAVTAALGPLLEQVAGLPGAPVRVTQVAVTSVQQEPS